ncbi:type II secretion system F family protein [Dongia deserti]|uniref:type II secretion system F family protein n=1 Tax=Dongia deserti TaxID=2268030 RepID=UPI0013C47DE0|nr:type II secretion system F family protein [Dongia deserti]
MPVYLTYLFYGAIFVSVLLLVEGLFYLLAGPGGGTVASPNRRLRMLVGGDKREEVLVRLQRERPLPASDHARNPLEWFLLLISQSGVRRSPNQVMLLMAAIGALSAIILMAIYKSAVVAAPVAVLVGFVLPVLVLMLRRRRRWKAMTAQLPDAIDIMVRSLRAGHPVATSISMVAREMRDPLATEFGLVVDEMTYGLTLENALSNMARRVGLGDLRFLVVAVTIQVEVGGNLAEILSGLSRVIRERFKMRAKIRALSAEGRFSAVLLSILPFALIGVINLIAPRFYSAVKDDPVFWPILGFGFFLMVVGIIVMFRMVNFRV